MGRGKLSSRGMKKPNISTTALLHVLLIGLFWNLFPLVVFFTDPNSQDLCLINLKNLFYTGLCFLKLAFALLNNRVRTSLLRYGVWRVFCCGLFIVLSSYLFVAVVLDRSALWTWEIFKSNYINRLEDSIVMIDETRSQFMVRDREIPGPEPLKLERLMRYEGEDVRMVCEDVLIYQGIVKFHKKQVIWKHNGQIIESSSWHHITTVFEEVPLNITDTYFYRVKSNLEINLINAEDFGKYSCHVAKMATIIASLASNPKNYNTPMRHEKRETHTGKQGSAKSKNNEDYSERRKSSECPNVRKEQTRCPVPVEDLPPKNFKPLPYTWSAEFILEKIKPTRRIVSVPVGGIVSTSASYSYLNDVPSVVDFDHEINGRSFLKTCEGLDQSCSIFVFLYWFLWHDGGHYSNIPAFYKQLQMVEGVGGTSWQCVCPYTYGVHKFVFYRQFYNTALGTHEIIDVEYPDTVELVPQEPLVLDLYYNGSKKLLPLPELSCWGGIETTVCKYLEIILQSMACDFFLKEKQIFYGGIIVCVAVSYCLSKTLLTRVTNPIINMILRRRRVNIQPIRGRGTLAGLAPADNTVVKYDLYISYADEQMAMATEIAQALTSRGLRVCFRDNDVLGNEIVNQAVSRLIGESWKFLVIVSQEYVDSGLQNNFEIHLIIQRLRDGYINNKNVAMLAINPDLIPDVFSGFVILSHYENSSDVLDDILLWHRQSLFPNESYTSAQITELRHCQGIFDGFIIFLIYFNTIVLIAVIFHIL
ncbi:uncharacterized protein [Haliotis cracherodii]|uniref:uncharacterized protein n=1 Tax=Haliotis cracherodii TaxID=6455 RepID=UPI0039EA39A6